MTRSRRAGGLAIGSAIAGVTLAAATGVAAWGLTTSYEHLLDTPQLYGAEWDAIVGNVSTETQAADSARRLAAIPGIRAVQILSLSGQQPDPAFAITSARPVVGEVSFGTVTRGRPPATSKEVALGADSMDEFGVDIGDDVSLPPGADDPVSFRVVGEVLVNDGFETRPGDGALVTPEAYDVIAAAGGDASTYAVWVDDDHDRTKTLAAVRDAFPTTYLEPRPPDKIANLQHVAAQPKLLTLVVGVLAGAALIHALAMSVTRSRRQIGVLKTLGFTRRQVISSVGWHATTIAAAALVVGIPLGVILGRLAWTAISQSIGVRVEHSLPAAAIGIVVGVVVVVANVAALVPGAAAARTRTALALRAE
jgi:putative ABC transport system permease protein